MAKKAPWIISAATVCVLAAGGGGTAFAMSDEAQMDVYGEQSTVRTFSPTVAELLEAQGVEVKDTDLVSPSLDTQVTDGIEITIQHQREVTVTVDGEPQTVLTAGTTVEDILSDVDFEREKAEITPGLSTELNGDDASVDVVTHKKITFAGQYGEVDFGVNALTVGEAMDEVLTNIEDTDTTSVPRDTPIEDGMTVEVERVREKERTVTEEVDFKTTTEKDDSLEEGKTKVKTEGKVGTREKVVTDKIVDGKVVGTEVVSEKITEKPQDKVVLEGTKEAPEPSPSSSSDSESESSDSSDSSSDSSSSSSDDDDSSSGSDSKSSAPAAASGGVWDRLAQCESGGDWSINTGNGFSGGLQFTKSTWLGYGGGKYAPVAHQASRSEQIEIAKKVQAGQGWGAWPACTSKLGIR